MLKEITINELLNTDGHPTYFLDIDKGQIVTVEDMLSGFRILKEVDTQEPAQEEPLPVVETIETPESNKRKRRSANELKDIIMKTWNKGEKNAYQIAQETGINYKTVRHYIPINKED